MKKLAIFLAIMLIPFSAFALDTISDNDLDSVTGQAGVSILTSSIQIVKTGVTTTYTDSNGANSTGGVGTTFATAGSFSIVADATTTQIFFQGFDPLNIDVIDTEDVEGIVNIAIGSAILAGDIDNTAVRYNGTDNLGESAVQITLPNGIKIVNQGSVKTYYASGTDGIGVAGNEMIRITTTGGSTLIGLADISEGMMWSNVADELGDPLMHHTDQVKILITSHE